MFYKDRLYILLNLHSNQNFVCTLCTDKLYAAVYTKMCMMKEEASSTLAT